VIRIRNLLRIPRVVKVIFQLKWINAFFVNVIHGRSSSDVFAF